MGSGPVGVQEGPAADGKPERSEDEGAPTDSVFTATEQRHHQEIQWTDGSHLPQELRFDGEPQKGVFAGGDVASAGGGK